MSSNFSDFNDFFLSRGIKLCLLRHAQKLPETFVEPFRCHAARKSGEEAPRACVHLKRSEVLSGTRIPGIVSTVALHIVRGVAGRAWVGTNGRKRQRRFSACDHSPPTHGPPCTPLRNYKISSACCNSCSLGVIARQSTSSLQLH